MLQEPFLIDCNYFLLQEPPFIMHNPEYPKKSKDPFKGLCMDLLHELQKRIDFHYTIYLVPDNTYGILDQETRQWNGLMREVIDRVNSYYQTHIIQIELRQCNGLYSYNTKFMKSYSILPYHPGLCHPGIEMPPLLTDIIFMSMQNQHTCYQT